MGTQLYLRSTTDNGIGANTYDMVTTAGSSSTETAITNTVASGTEVQLSKTAGGSVIEWVSGRSPSGGWTISGTVTFNLRAQESNMSANVGGRVRLYKRTSGGTVTEIGGGPWDDGVEFSTTVGSFQWAGTPTSTAFSEDDRLLVRFFLTNIGTMGGGYTATVELDRASTNSWILINENITFKAESSNQTLTPGLFTNSATFYAATVSPGPVTLTPSLFTNTNTFYSATVSAVLNPSRVDNTQAFYSATITTGPVTLTPSLYSNTNTFYVPTVTPGAVTLTPALFSNSNTFYSPTIPTTLSPARLDNSGAFYSATVTAGPVTLTPALYTNTNTFYAATVTPGAVTLTPSLYTNSNTFYAATVSAGAVTLTPALVSNGQTFYSATVTAGPVTLTPGLFENAAAFYSPTVTANDQTLSPSLFSNTPDFYAAVVTPGVAALLPGLFTSANLFYAPTVSSGDAESASTGGGWIDPKVARSLLRKAQAFQRASERRQKDDEDQRKARLAALHATMERAYAEITGEALPATETLLDRLDQPQPEDPNKAVADAIAVYVAVADLNDTGAMRAALDAFDDAIMRLRVEMAERDDEEVLLLIS